MNVLRIAGVVLVAATSTVAVTVDRDAGAEVAGPGQPYAPNWHPQDLLTWRLPATRLSVVASGGMHLSAVLRFADAPDVDVVVPLGKARSDWTSLSAGLSRHAGRTLTSVGLRLSDPSAPNVEVHVGELAVRGPAPKPLPPSSVRAVPARDGGIRVTWKASRSKDVRYQVLVLRADGSRVSAGVASYGAKYVLPSLATGAVRVEVEAVGLDGQRSRAVPGNVDD